MLATQRKSQTLFTNTTYAVLLVPDVLGDWFLATPDWDIATATDPQGENLILVQAGLPREDVNDAVDDLNAGVIPLFEYIAAVQ